MFARLFKTKSVRGTAFSGVLALVLLIAGGVGSAWAAAPYAPSSVSTTAGSASSPGSVSLSASLTSNSGARAVGSVRIQYCPDANYTAASGACSSTWISGALIVPDAGVSTATGVQTGLTGGTSYRFGASACSTNTGTGCSAYTYAASAVTPSATVPGAPSVSSFVAGAGQATVTFAAPSSNGGSAITDYLVEYKLTSAASWSTWSHSASGAVLSYTITGLTNGSSYDVRVSAVNSVGTGAASASSSSTPVTVPDAPTASVAYTSGTSLTVSWNAPGTGGSAITDYTLQYKLTSDSTWSTWSHVASASTRSYVVSGLTQGSTYDFRVSAVNAVGSGAYSAVVSKNPATKPPVALIQSLVAGNGEVTVTYQQRANQSGVPLLDHQIEYKLTSDSTWITWSHSPNPVAVEYTITGLTNGLSYDVRVSTVNDVGVGPTNQASATPVGAPVDAPSLNALTYGDNQLTATFAAPANNGGASIDAFKVEYKLSSASSWTTYSDNSMSAMATITGLTNNASYDVRVSAHNSYGWGPTSSTRSVNLATLLYTVDSSGATPVVSIDGCRGTCPASLVIPATLDGYPVTKISSYAFDGESAITSVSMPNSIVWIGYKAFWGATDTVKSPGIPAVTSGNIASVALSSSLVTIRGYAFASQPRLVTMTLPNTVTTIEPYAFRHDTGLTAINVGTGLTTLGAWAFHDCSSLTSITLPAGVTSIEKATFFGDTSLATVSLPSGITHMGQYSFSGTALTSVALPSSLTTIDQSVFRGISTLTSVTVGANVATVGNYAFGDNNYVTIQFRGNKPATLSPVAFSTKVSGTASIPANVVIQRATAATGWPATFSGHTITTVG